MLLRQDPGEFLADLAVKDGAGQRLAALDAKVMRPAVKINPQIDPAAFDAELLTHGLNLYATIIPKYQRPITLSDSMTERFLVGRQMTPSLP